jgi:Putative zinc- or iron-chelating domain
MIATDPLPPAVAAPDPIVTQLLREGPDAQLSPETSRFREDEGLALLRHYLALLATRTPAASDRLASTITGIGDAAMAKYRHPQAFACKKGCAWCCFQLVTVSAPEVFAIARHVRQRPDLAAALPEKAARRRHDPEKPSDMRSPCVFLDRGTCGIHELRPLTCRYYASFDVAACLRRINDADADVPYPGAHVPLRSWQAAILFAALAEAGLPLQDYELGDAVALVLADPGIEARWYAGDDGLAAAASPRSRPGAATLAAAAAWRARLAEPADQAPPAAGA